jgi:hypothetical protein
MIEYFYTLIYVFKKGKMGKEGPAGSYGVKGTTGLLLYV